MSYAKLGGKPSDGGFRTTGEDWGS